MSAGPTARPAAAPAAPSVQPVPATPAAAPVPAARRRRLVAVVATALAVAGAVTAGGYGLLAVAAAGGHAGVGGLVVPGPAGPAGPGHGEGAAPALGPGPVTVHLAIEHSRFTLDPGPLRVAAGTEVRFVVGNGDPIGHELIVGPPEVHARHASGTHAAHGAVPGEVSVAPGAEGVTTFVFDAPGTVEYACHLAGHYDYGMHGAIEVIPA
jgi:uncharacterized cupredoxin-like copper-binding protein